MSDLEISKRLANIEHILAILLSSGSERPSKLSARFPPPYSTDIIDNAERMWDALHQKDEHED